jgi:hypothetical protein
LVFISIMEWVGKEPKRKNPISLGFYFLCMWISILKRVR